MTVISLELFIWLNLQRRIAKWDHPRFRIRSEDLVRPRGTDQREPNLDYYNQKRVNGPIKTGIYLSPEDSL